MKSTAHPSFFSLSFPHQPPINLNPPSYIDSPTPPSSPQISDLSLSIPPDFQEPLFKGSFFGVITSRFFWVFFFSREMGSETKVYTLAQVSEHNNSKDCWLIIGGKVFNLKFFVKSTDFLWAFLMIKVFECRSEEKKWSWLFVFYNWFIQTWSLTSFEIDFSIFLGFHLLLIFFLIFLPFNISHNVFSIVKFLFILLLRIHCAMKVGYKLYWLLDLTDLMECNVFLW